MATKRKADEATETVSNEETIKSEFAEFYKRQKETSEGGDMIAQKLATDQLPLLNAVAHLLGIE